MKDDTSIRKRNSGLTNTWRLTTKELKEILRDRRTVLTLIGMPLLIYPLLSILFQKFYFSAAAERAETRYRFVLDEERIDREGNQVPDDQDPPRFSDEDLVEFFAAKYINLGEAYNFPELEFPPAEILSPLAEDQVDPLFVRSNEKRYFQDNQISVRSRDGIGLEEIIKQGEADVGIRVVRAPGRRTHVEIVQLKSGISARAANYLRKRIDATNLVLSRMQIHRLQMPWIGSRYRTIQFEGEKKSPAISMASLVPLILILMTVTGAVYPAIDLTAGERERGTLEALIAAPVPRFQVLFAKFIGVLTVAMMTAVVNMLGMFSTLLVFGLLPILFGDQAFSVLVLLEVFALLLLFAGFFSAVLLAVTSFARSFKEAQAYIVPLMLVSITPGIFSLTPNLRLEGVLTVISLINIVLLARGIMEGTASSLPAIIAITSTALYGFAALSVAAVIFGSDSILYGNQTSWRSMLRRPARRTRQIPMTLSLTALAMIFPLSFLSIGLVGQVPRWASDNLGIEPSEVSYAYTLIPFVLSTIFVFVVVPGLFLWHSRVRIFSAVRLNGAPAISWLAAFLLGVGLWPLTGELVDQVNQFTAGQGTDPQWKQELLEKAQAIVQQWRTISPVLIVACFSVIPAICEEFFFRGVLLRSWLVRNRPMVAIVLSALTFGVFHTLSLSDLSSQKFLPSFLAGLVLAWLAVRSGSLLPGILLHSLNNGLLVLLAYYEPVLVDHGWIESSQSGFPRWVLGLALVLTSIGLLAVWISGRQAGTTEDSGATETV